MNIVTRLVSPPDRPNIKYAVVRMRNDAENQHFSWLIEELLKQGYCTRRVIVFFAEAMPIAEVCIECFIFHYNHALTLLTRIDHLQCFMLAQMTKLSLSSLTLSQKKVERQGFYSQQQHLVWVLTARGYVLSFIMDLLMMLTIMCKKVAELGEITQTAL